MLTYTMTVAPATLPVDGRDPTSGRPTPSSNLVLSPAFSDVALRSFGLLIPAVASARLASAVGVHPRNAAWAAEKGVTR
jgi:hypothetical protein